MVSLPPPPPASGGVKGVPKVAMTTGLTAPSSPSRSSGSSPKAGIYFAFFLAIIATGSSLALLVIAGDSLELRVLGYCLGGIVGPIALGIGTVAQRSALRDPNFSPMLRVGLATKILAFAGIASAIVQILVASTEISEYISEFLIQAGWQL